MVRLKYLAQCPFLVAVVTRYAAGLGQSFAFEATLVPCIPLPQAVRLQLASVSSPEAVGISFVAEIGEFAALKFGQKLEHYQYLSHPCHCRHHYR